MLADTGPPGVRFPSLSPDGTGGFLRFGGCGFSAGAVDFADTLWRWDGRWSRIPAGEVGPAPRYTSAFVRRGSAFYLFGGNSQASDRRNTYYGDLWVLEDGRWRLVHDEGLGPGPRYGFGWVRCDDILYVFGGFDGEVDRNDLWALDLTSLSWTEMPAGPKARYCPALGVHEGRLVLFGGRSKTNPKVNLSDTWIFCDDWEEWDGPSPGYHAKSAFATCPDGLWIYGGEGLRGHVSDTWRFGVDGWSCLDAGIDGDPVLW